MIDLAERHAAALNAASEQLKRSIDRALEDYNAMLMQLEIERTTAMEHRMRSFQGLIPVEEPKPAIAISAPKPQPRPVELLNDEGDDRPLPRIIGR